jgi:predicted PurR-regulated permease PerM
MSQSARISYVIIAVLAVLVAGLHLATFVLATLFGYLALKLFTIRGIKWLSVNTYLFVVVSVGIGLVYFSNLAYKTFPKIANSAIPAVVAYAEKVGIDLPFTDFESLKAAALDEAQQGVTVIGKAASTASLHFVLVIAGLVVALCIYLSPGWTTKHDAPPGPDNLFRSVTRELTARFGSFYDSFAKVIGAQIIISAVNTALTVTFLLLNHYPYAGLLATFVFLCGLLPIVGNIVSNSVIVAVGFTISARTGLYALLFLIVIHKLEYFLNSKIIGGRIHCPMWLTLVGLLVRERLMGLSGMVLAPVALHFIKVEASAVRALPDVNSAKVGAFNRAQAERQESPAVALKSEP